MNALRASGGLLLSCIAFAAFTRASAQQANIANVSFVTTSAPSCLDRIADSSLTPGVLYLHASEAKELDAVAQARVAEIDLFTQTVVDRMFGLLHARAGVLPAGEPLATWRSRESDVRIVIDRNGRFTARPSSTAYVDPAILGSTEPSHVLADALDSLRADGDVTLFAAGPADSVAFNLSLSSIALGAEGKPYREKWRLAFPVMTLRMPVESTVWTLRNNRAPQYPERERRLNYEAVVNMTFVVDTTGHADPATIRDVLPPTAAPLTDDEKLAYGAFVRSVTTALRTMQYEPARMGGCRVRMLVRQPFTFGLSTGNFLRRQAHNEDFTP